MLRECLVFPKLARYESYGGISNANALDMYKFICSRLTLKRRLLSSEVNMRPAAERSDNHRSG